jgi:hypothetical protein
MRKPLIDISPVFLRRPSVFRRSILLSQGLQDLYITEKGLWDFYELDKIIADKKELEIQDELENRL